MRQVGKDFARLQRNVLITDKVQNSVFEVDVDYGTFLKLKDRLMKIIDEEQDSLRFYYLGNNWKRRVEHIGAKETYDPEGSLIL